MNMKYAPGLSLNHNVITGFIGVLILFATLYLPCHLWARPISQDGVKGVPQQISCYEDRSGKLTISDMTSGSYRNAFKPVRDIPNFGYTSSAVWLRFDVRNPLPEAGDYIIEILYPAIDLIEVYMPGDSGYVLKRSGDSIPFTDREIHHRNSLFKLSFEPDENKRVFIRIASGSSLSFKVNFYDMDSFLVNDYREQFALGIFYGILLVMLLYNLFLFFSVRDRAYLLYVFYILSQIMFALSIEGLAFQLFWPGLPRWASLSHPFFTSTTIFFCLLFSYIFLNIKNESAVIAGIFRFLMAMPLIVMLVTPFVPYRIPVTANALLAILFLPFLFFSGIYMIRKGFHPARYYLAAWSFLIIGGLLYSFMHTGLLSRGPLTEYGVQLGTVFEVTLLALALGDRINVLRKAKDDFDTFRELDRIKTDFIANISHEIRTPLTLMLTPVWEILENNSGKLPDRNFLYMLERNGSRLLGLINDLLSFSRLNSGKMKTRLIFGDILEFVRNQIAVAEPACGVKGITVRLSSPEGPVMLYFDPDKVESIIGNVIGNAIRFAGKGGVISITVTEGTDKAVIEIVDNGPGIEPDRAGKIFDHFGQPDSDVSVKLGGTGIGLAIVKQFVELHGGSLSIESRHIGEYPENHGAGFIITFLKGKKHFENRDDVTFHENISMTRPFIIPDEDVASVADFNEAPEPADPDALPVIMVVEDEVDMHGLLRQILTPFFKPICFFDPIEALEYLRTVPDLPDIILSDVMMPGMDGYALTREIRSDDRFTGIPVILLTAKTRTGMKIEGFKSGATDYITKPFSSRELVARIRAHLEMKKLRDRLLRSNTMLYRKLKNSGNKTNVNPSQDTKEKIAKVVEFINENFTADISREGLAAAVDMSPDYLSRMFNRVIGTRMDEYINGLRAAEAARRLVDTDDPAAVIASESGFESYRHFNRVFIKLYGKNPTEYRLAEKTT